MFILQFLIGSETGNFTLSNNREELKNDLVDPSEKTPCSIFK